MASLFVTEGIFNVVNSEKDKQELKERQKFQKSGVGELQILASFALFLSKAL